ncbi:hypothetical protein [Solitalea lacus]|uniref:hypothetical protein n=1 Tax=Solitalea lacus TaxID=2911172 RepID=UPI001EDADDD0|nr:hypothetical protein [Solitalea lacus]UKJ07230.1 hypothetical protein L2B55_17095 [Solitalea lacus]
MIITDCQDKRIENGKSEANRTHQLSLTPKEEFSKLCQQEDSIPLFNRDWWLDIVCGEGNWDVVLTASEGVIQGAWTYCVQRKFNRVVSKMPKLTPFLGVWIRPCTLTMSYKQIHHEKKVCNELINKLPNFSFISQKFGSQFTNWQPFYWKGFKQTVNYSYFIEDILKWKEATSHLSVLKQVQNSEFNEIRLGLPSPQDFNDLKRKHNGANITLPSYLMLSEVHKELKRRGAGEIIYIVNHLGKINSIIFTVWDSIKAYTIIWKSNDPNETIHLLNKAVDLASFNVNKMELFEVTGNEIERHLLKGGACQLAYHSIFKANKFIYRLALFLGLRSYSTM